MKNSRIAAQLRGLSLKPSLENADAESTTETGPGSEAVVKTDVDTSAESPNQTTDETTPAEDKSLSVKTTDVGERSDLESAQTKITAGDGAPVVSAESTAEGEIPDNSKNVDASAETGPDGEGVVKQKLDEEAASPNQTTEETTPAENKDLSTKTVDVGERSDLESAETTSDKDGENVVVSTESLIAAGIIGLAAGFSTWAAGKFVKEVDSIEHLQKQIKQVKAETTKAEQEFVDRAKAVAAAAKAKAPTVSQEADNAKPSVGQQLRGALSASITTGIGAVGGFALGGPIGAAIGALIMAGAWTGDMKIAAKKCRDKRAELLGLELKLADRQLELATRVAAAEKEYKVSNESLSEFDAMTVSTESFKSVIKFIISKERRLEWSLEKGPQWHAELEAEIQEVRDRIERAKSEENPVKIKQLQKELAWLIDELDESKATQAEFAAELKRIRAKKASAQKIVSTESFDDAAAAAAAAFAEGAAGAAEAAAAATATDESVAETAADVAETVAENVAEEVAGEAGAEEGAEGEVEGTIEEGEAELTELDSNIEEGEAHAEEYEQASATMESLIDALSQAQRSGGLTPQAARFATITFESVGIRLTGAPFKNAHGESAMPSLESFGGTMRRDQATTISLENAKEWFAKVWEVLKSTWEQIRNWTVNFVKALFSQAERYKQRAQKIQEAAKGATGQPKNRTIKAGAAGAKMAVGNDVGVNNMSHLLNFATKVKASAGNGVTAGKAAVDFLAGLDQAKVDALKAAADGGDAGSVAAFGPFTNEVDMDGAKGYATEVLPGNFRLVAVPTEANAILAAMAKAVGQQVNGSVKIVRKDEEGGAGEDATMQVWTGPQIGSVAAHVLKTLAVVTELRKGWETATQLTLRAGTAEIADEDQKYVRQIVSATQRALHSQAGGVKAIGQALVGACGAYLDVCATQLKEYGVNVGVVDKAVAGAKDAAKDAALKATDAGVAGLKVAGKAAGAVEKTAKGAVNGAIGLGAGINKVVSKAI